jgi:hypothetical protein
MFKKQKNMTKQDKSENYEKQPKKKICDKTGQNMTKYAKM